MRTYLKKAAEHAPAVMAEVETTVREMLRRIRDEGDEAVRHYARTLDKWESGEFRLSPDRIRQVTSRLPQTFKDDFALCLHNIQEFARRQRD